MVLNSSSDSWLRNNWMANLLWSIDDNLIGFLSLSDFFPRGLRYAINSYFMKKYNRVLL